MLEKATAAASVNGPHNQSVDVLKQKNQQLNANTTSGQVKLTSSSGAKNSNSN